MYCYELSQGQKVKGVVVVFFFLLGVGWEEMS